VTQAFAQGGNGGRANGVGFNPGLGGNAEAYAIGGGGFTYNATATAVGGFSPGAPGNGSALARAEGQSGGGTNTAAAISGGNLAPIITASALGPAAGGSKSESRAASGAAFPSVTLADGLQAASFVVGSPQAADVTAAVAGNPHAAAMVGGGANVIGMMLLSGHVGPTAGPQTFTSSATFQVDLTQITSLQDLQLASLDGDLGGSGFDELRLEVIRENVTVVDELIPNTAADLSYFNDQVFNLDDIETGVVGTLDVTVRLSLTTDDSGAGFSSLFILANSPLAPLDADYNNNGVVDAADDVVWRKGLSPFPNSASDHNLWRNQFGQSVPGASPEPASSYAGVPEPTTFAILVASGIIWFVSQRRRRTFSI
jgi:hypothetical protein